MILYLAWEIVYHEYEMVIGIYSTRELADAAIDARKQGDRAKWVDEWRVDEAQLDTVLGTDAIKV